MGKIEFSLIEAIGGECVRQKMWIGKSIFLWKMMLNVQEVKGKRSS